MVGEKPLPQKGLDLAYRNNLRAAVIHASLMLYERVLASLKDTGRVAILTPRCEIDDQNLIGVDGWV